MIIFNTAVWYTEKLLRVNPKGSLYKDNFPPFIILYLYEMMLAYCINHFTIYVKQTIMTYALNLSSDVWQFFLPKPEKKVNVIHQWLNYMLVQIQLSFENTVAL